MSRVLASYGLSFKIVASVLGAVAIPMLTSAPAAAQQTIAQVIADVVAQNGDDPAALQQALLPLLAANPRLANQVIAIAQNSSPTLAAALAQALYGIQTLLKVTNPSAAAVIAAAVAAAPATFLANYGPGGSFGLTGRVGSVGTTLGTFGSSQGAQPVSGTQP